MAKTGDGSYGLTPLGRLTCALLPSFQVLASLQEYFLSHDLSLIPTEFLGRIGDLAQHQYLDHLDEVLGLVEEATKGATEYVWIITDRPLRLEHGHPRPESLSVRCVVPRSFDDTARSLLRQNWPGAHVELGYLEPIPVALVLNERQAGVLFPGLDGRIDLSRGLSGESVPFHAWCVDLFSYYWVRARKALLSRD